jgi:hypothetical protein
MIPHTYLRMHVPQCSFGFHKASGCKQSRAYLTRISLSRYGLLAGEEDDDADEHEDPPAELPETFAVLHLSDFVFHASPR